MRLARVLSVVFFIGVLYPAATLAETEKVSEKKRETCKLCPGFFMETDFMRLPLWIGSTVPQAVMDEAADPRVTHGGTTYEATPFTIKGVEFNPSNTSLLPEFRFGWQPGQRVPLVLGLTLRPPNWVRLFRTELFGQDEFTTLHEEHIRRADIKYLLLRKTTYDVVSPFALVYLIPPKYKRKIALALEMQLSGQKIQYLATKETFGIARPDSPDARIIASGRGRGREYGLRLVITHGDADPFDYYVVSLRNVRGDIHYPDEALAEKGQWRISGGWGARFGQQR